MTLPFVQVDAFTAVPFRGNPAAVVFLDAPADPAWMQQVAAEMNLAETAFVAPGAEAWGLRWFTPTVEVDLCGHATLAAAHALWETGRLPGPAPARFATASGVLTCVGRGGWIEMDFPAEPAAAAEPPPGLLPALGTEARWVGRNRLDWLVEVDGEATVRRLVPDLGALARVEGRGVIVTAAGGGTGYDFVSRFFAPGAGIPEDPVTGSAHCALGPYWAARTGKTALTGYQASPRGGVVRVRPAGARVVLAGQAVTVLRGELV